MYVIAGATGRVGGAVADELLQAEAPVRVLIRDASQGEVWRARGAQVCVTDLTDRDRLGHALDGAIGCFVLLPFDATDPDLEATTSQLIESIAGAAGDSRVPHVVMLSSGGADLPAGTGPIVALHHLEAALRATGTTLTALRAGHFQERVSDLLDTITGSGIYPVFADSADVPISMVASRDVGRVAADTLLTRPPVSEAIDVLGPTFTERQVASLLASLLSRDIEVATIPREAWSGALAGSGLPGPAAEALAELYAASEDGLLAPRGDKTVIAATPLEATLAGLLRVGVHRASRC